LLDRSTWRRCKHGHARRRVTRVQVANYQLPGSSFVNNTSCTALLSGATGSASAIPLPP
jgi:hypothetical protein